MELVPVNRDQAVRIAEEIDEEDLTREQIAAYRNLYRLDDVRTISELLAAGELSSLTSHDVSCFVRRLRRRRINTRADLDHVSAFLRRVTDPVQKRQIRNILPTVTSTEYFLIVLLRQLDDGDNP